MRKLIWIVIQIIVFNCAFGQISQGGTPYSFITSDKQGNTLFGLQAVETIPIFEMQPVDPVEIQEIIDNNNEGTNSYQFAIGFDIDIDVKASAKIDSLDIGLLYRLSIKSSGAYSINMTFNEYYVPSGAKLFIYNTNKDHVIGAFTSNNNKKSKILPTIPVSGDEVIIEYFEPYYPKFNGSLQIRRVGHDFIGSSNNSLGKISGLEDSGDCQVGINCSEGSNWQYEKRGVCKLIIGNTGICSGSLINNTNFDGAPYFLTANHCISDQATANNSVFIFNYESPSCSSIEGSENHSISGADIISTGPSSDFALLNLSKIPLSTYIPYYNGWDRSNSPDRRGVGIHHPQGDTKKIATQNIIPGNSDCMQFDPYSNQNFWRINWIETQNGYSIMEGGSSGSPLFNNNHNIIGQLYGFGDCPDPNCSDPESDIANYGKIFSSWDSGSSANSRLKEWLDPANSQLEKLYGSGICGEMEDIQYLSHTSHASSVELYQAKDLIQSTNVINSDASVTYAAGNSISLKSGFHAKAGSNFHAEIAPINCVPGCDPITVQAWTNFVYEGESLCYYVSNATNFSVEINDQSGILVYSDSGTVSGDYSCVMNNNNFATRRYTITTTFTSDCDEISETYKIDIY